MVPVQQPVLCSDMLMTGGFGCAYHSLDMIEIFKHIQYST